MARLLPRALMNGVIGRLTASLLSARPLRERAPLRGARRRFISDRAKHKPTFACALVLIAATVASADVVQLKSGALLRGTIKTDAKAKTDALEVQLLSGTVISVAKEDVAEIVRRPLKFEQYAARVQELDDELEAHWLLSEWCRENRLDEQRRVHLERVLDFDSEHKRAHLGLGHTQQDGEWLRKEEVEERKREQGFVKFNGKYVPITQLESLQAKAEQTEAQKEWFAKVRQWLQMATGPNAGKAADGLNAIREIRSPDAVAALMQLLGKHAREDVRRLAVETIAKIGGHTAAVPLTTFVLREDVRDIREQALASFKSDQAEIARAVFVKALRDRNNVIVRRAGLGLMKVGDGSSVNPLINALLTTHSTTIRVAVPTVGGRVDGKLPHPSGLPDELVDAMRRGQFPNGFIYAPGNSAGITREVPVQATVENEEVLLALKKLTKQNFGFDKASWARWWNVEKTQAVIAPDLP